MPDGVKDHTRPQSTAPAACLMVEKACNGAGELLLLGGTTAKIRTCQTIEFVHGLEKRGTVG
jgi:hypothetical protein